MAYITQNLTVMTTPNKKRFSWAMLALAAVLFAGVYSCNTNPPAEEKKEEAAPAPTAPAPDSTTKAVDSTAKSTTDTTGKGTEKTPPR